MYKNDLKCLSQRIYDCFMVNTMPLLSKIYSQISKKNQFWHQISMGNMTLCSKDRHPLLLEYFSTSPICIGMIWRVSDCISDPLLLTHCHSYKIYTPMSSKITNVFKLDQHGKIWLHVTRTDIHCLLSVPYLPFNGEEWLEELIWLHIQSPHGQHRVFLIKSTLKFQAK